MLITSKVMLPPSEKLDLTFSLNMIRKDVVYLAIIVVLLIIVAILTCQSPPPDPSEALYLDSIKELKSQKSQISSRMEDLQVYASNKAIQDSIQLRAQEREISRLKIKASKARTPRVDTLILDNPELKVFVEAQDSVIQEQGVLIDTLKSQLAFERNVREQLVALHYDQAKIESQMSEIKDQRIIALEKDLKKERRRGRLKAVLLPIVGVAGLLLGSQM